jgi:hypothetical protein
VILQPVVGAGGGYTPRLNAELQGVKNGSNPIFTLPDKALNTSELSPSVVWNGRRLRSGVDYVLSESGGAGTGYDTVTLSQWQTAGFLPRAGDELVADYFIDPSV